MNEIEKLKAEIDELKKTQEILVKIISGKSDSPLEYKLNEVKYLGNFIDGIQVMVDYTTRRRAILKHIDSSFGKTKEDFEAFAVRYATHGNLTIDS